MKYLVKPLTRKMLGDLRNGRAIELSKINRNICNTDDFKGSLSGLHRRGFVNTQMVEIDGKKNLNVYITMEGISFLDRYEADAKKLGQQNGYLNNARPDAG